MIFTATSIDGAFLITPERFEDERGFFARLYCPKEFAAHGLNPKIVQRSLSCQPAARHAARDALPDRSARGEQDRLLSERLDLRRRRGSASGLGDLPHQWVGATLTAAGLEALFIPKGCAHGFITLADDTRVHYEISEFHHPESARGVRYDDPAFGIDWPLDPVVIAARDRSYPLVGTGEETAQVRRR